MAHGSPSVRYTGLRKVAALLTVWGNVDLVGARLRIPGENTKGGYGGRELPLHPDLVRRLRSWEPGAGRVIRSPEKELPPHRGHIDRSFRRAWKRTDASPEVYAHHPIHGSRHLIETEWAGLGIHQGVIDGFLGHTPQGTGGRHYRGRRSPQLWQATIAAVASMPRLVLPDEVSPVIELSAQSVRPRLKG
ncbi:MAG: hypothetical protein P8R54_09735 [Myxococcota bacterium]|nr:hypothetical protein [Myxococcota bacterium]